MNNKEKADFYEDALMSILSWATAYPISVFPEPDLVKARSLLEAGGMTLDAVSASNMRHALSGVGRIAAEAISAASAT